MPNGIQNQLKKVDCQLLGRHGKTLHKVEANQCPKGRNKARITKQFAKEGVAQPQTSFAETQLKNKCSKVSRELSRTERTVQTDMETSSGAEILTCLEHVVQHSKKDIVFLVRRKTLVRMKVNF